jgi:hypothetical protein
MHQCRKGSLVVVAGKPFQQLAVGKLVEAGAGEVPAQVVEDRSRLFLGHAHAVAGVKGEDTVLWVRGGMDRQKLLEVGR